jgi:hypothetical protein
MKLFHALLLLILLSGIAGAQELNPCDQNGINQALQNGGSVYLNPGVYEVTGTINIHSNTVLTGSPDAIIRVSPSSSQWFTGSIGIISCSQSLKNVEISGFQIDGNLMYLPASYANTAGHDKDCERCMILGGYTNDYADNIKIHDMKLYNSFSDGIQMRFARNSAVYNNFISNCQHEGIFWTCIENSEIYNNRIAGITSDCTRLDNCIDCKVHDNTLFSYDGDNTNGAYKHGENGLQVGDAGSSHGYDASNKPTTTTNIEICNNTFADNGLKAITGSGGDNVYIHDNKFIGQKELETMGIPVDISEENPVTVNRSEKVFSSIFDILRFDFSTVFHTGIMKPANYSNINLVNVTVLNNSFNPQTRYNVVTDNYTMKVCYEFEGNKTWHFIKVASGSHLETVDTWKRSKDTGTLDNIFIVPKVLNDTQKVKITVYSIFGKSTIQNYNVTEYDEEAGSFINPFAVLILSMMIILSGGIWINIGSVKLKWRIR